MKASISFSGILFLCFVLFAYDNARADDSGADDLDDFEKGLLAYKVENYSKAMDIWSALANQGDVRAVTHLGHLYFRGKGVELDYDEAFDLYARAAKKNYPQAQFALGIIFSQGLGVAQNYETANTWLALAAVQEFAPAQHKLAQHYERGLGTKQDLQKAIASYRRAANQGSDKAQTRMGAYYLAQGDKQTAANWFKLSAEQNNLTAQLRLGDIYKDVNLTQAARWYALAARQESAAAQRELGLIFLKGGGGVRLSPYKGVSFLGVSAEKGDAAAQVALASVYIEAKVVERDVPQALRLLQAAAAQEHGPAFLALGKLYTQGEYVALDLSEAKAWLNKAQAAGVADAYYYLGKAAERQGRQKDAARLFKQGVEKGSARAALALGNIYLKGSPQIARDVRKARIYLLPVAQRGHRVAQYNLAASWTLKTASANPNLEEALKWLLVSSRQGLGRAQKLLPNIRRSLSPRQVRRAERAADALIRIQKTL